MEPFLKQKNWEICEWLMLQQKSIEAPKKLRRKEIHRKNEIEFN